MNIFWKFLFFPTGILVVPKLVHVILAQEQHQKLPGSIQAGEVEQTASVDVTQQPDVHRTGLPLHYSPHVATSPEVWQRGRGEIGTREEIADRQGVQETVVERVPRWLPWGGGPENTRVATESIKNLYFNPCNKKKKNYERSFLFALKWTPICWWS